MQKRLFRAAFLLALDLLPLREHALGPIDLGLAKHMRMTADELLRDAARHAVDVERPGLRGDLRVEERLQQQVAQFFAKMRHVAGARGLRDLIGLLDQVRNERFMSLLRVPRASTGRAQSVHHGTKSGEGVCFLKIIHVG